MPYYPPTASSSSSPTCLSFIPQPVIPTRGDATVKSLTSNTVQSFFQFMLPFSITVNKISIRTGTVGTAGTWDLTIYSENGQTQLIAITTASIAGSNQITTTAVAGVTLTAGLYWMGINPNSTAASEFCFYIENANAAFTVTEGLPYDVASEPVLAGQIAIAAGTPVATFVPTTDITQGLLQNNAVIFRLDN